MHGLRVISDDTGPEGVLVPQEIEAKGGDAIEAYVEQQLRTRPRRRADETATPKETE